MEIFPNFFSFMEVCPKFFCLNGNISLYIFVSMKIFPNFFCFNRKSFFIILITKKGNFTQFLSDSIEICFKIFCLTVKLSQNWLSQWKIVPMFFVSKENGLKIFCLNGKLSKIFLSQWKIVPKFFVSMVICPKIFLWQVAN